MYIKTIIDDKIIVNDETFVDNTILVVDVIFANNTFVDEKISIVDVILSSNTIVDNETFVENFVFVDKTITSISKRKSNLVYLTFEINFQLIDDLLYHVKKNYFKLCILNNCIFDILKLIHDDNSYIEYYQIYARLVLVYIRKLFKKFTNYIRYCSNCQLNQTKRHRFYEKFAFINTSHLFYHIIEINFILIFSK